MLEVDKKDTILTLTSGGCNALNLLLQGAGHVSCLCTACAESSTGCCCDTVWARLTGPWQLQVVAVDCNPAQSALLELKATAIRRAPEPRSGCCGCRARPLNSRAESSLVGLQATALR